MDGSLTWYYYLVSVSFGLVLGSFFNVVICRLPEGESLGKRSRCPGCGAMIRWYDNVPLLSFALLRGRCRTCGMTISWRYPAVELATGLLFALMYRWSTSVVPEVLELTDGGAFEPELVAGLLLVSVLVIVSAVDLDRRLIPNRVILPGLLLMLPLVIGLAIYRGDPWRIAGAAGTALGGALFFLGAGLLYGVLFMERSRPAGEELDPGELDPGELDPGELDPGDEMPTGMGMGDVKLMLFTGLLLGYFHWYFLLVHVLVSTLAAFLAFVPMKVLAGIGRKDRIPFGPFLALGAVVTLVWAGPAYVKLLT